jgi:Domain of Unknown Function (DUF1080)
MWQEKRGQSRSNRQGRLKDRSLKQARAAERIRGPMHTSRLFAAVLAVSTATLAAEPPPATDGPGWAPLFAADLADADKPAGVWSVANGEFTANADHAIWTKTDHENFTLDLEFKNDNGTNSGVIIYCTDTANWIPKSVEVQIADPFHEKWAKANKTWHGGGIFGHLAPAEQMTRKPGEWNRMILQAKGKSIKVWLNGTLTADMDMAKWTSAKKNPDGTDIPAWLSTPFAELPTKGRIGLQGKHGAATVWFRNVRIKADK